MALHTILGAGGAVSKELFPILRQNSETIRLVSRNAKLVDGAETISADLTNAEATMAAVKGSSVVYLLAGLPYDLRIWQAQWPSIMSNVIEACKAASARLIFFDNVYAYGLVKGTMTEEIPFRPSSKKGDVRAQIATQLLNEISTGRIEALIARSADFYGPSGALTGILNLLVFANQAKGKKAQWVGRPDLPHSFTYIPDAAKALYLLAGKESSFGQTWHLPTAANPLTGREYADLAAVAMKAPSGISTFPKWMMSVVGLFDRNIKESVEMTYQYDSPYLFDSTKFDKAFDFEPTSYQDGILQTAKSIKA